MVDPVNHNVASGTATALRETVKGAGQGAFLGALLTIGAVAGVIASFVAWGPLVGLGVLAATGLGIAVGIPGAIAGAITGGAVGVTSNRASREQSKYNQLVNEQNIQQARAVGQQEGYVAAQQEITHALEEQARFAERVGQRSGRTPEDIIAAKEAQNTQGHSEKIAAEQAQAVENLRG